MKKRTLLMALALLAALALATTGTLAYLTDTDSDTNVMILGDVSIEQIELQRAEGVEHTGTLKEGDLVSFQEGQALYPAFPAIGAELPYTAEPTDLLYWGPYVTAEGAGNGLWNDDKLTGAVDKMVFVQNTGTAPAYYRTVFAFECPEGVEYSEGADKQLMMNVNGNKRFVWEEHGYITVDGQRYLLMSATYQEALQPGEISRPSLLQVVMTHNATNEDVRKMGETYEILVVTQAAQTTNFPDANTAMTAAFGDLSVNSHPWMTEGEEGAQPPYESEPAIPVVVANEDELIAALAEGNSVILADDMSLADQPIVIKKGNNVAINLNGKTIEGTSSSSTTSYQIKVESGSKLTLAGNGKVSFTAGNPDTDWGAEGPKPFPGYANNTITNSGELVIDGATVENKTAAGGASYAIDNYAGADLTVNSGTVQGYDKVAIRMFSSNATVPTNVTINGGTIEGKRAIWVHVAGSNALVAPDINLTVNGGTLSSTDDPSDPAAYYMAIYSYSYGNSFANTDVTFTGGTFNGHVAFGGGYKGDQENVTVTGGTFNADLGRYLENDGWEDIAKP